MGLFGSKKEGGLMDVIRCDMDEKSDYLIWKWSPNNEKSKRENSIRYGSTIRVRETEVAVFVYTKDDGTAQEFIVGPCDKTLKTENFPILTSIVGLAYNGNSPIQAEVYFINLKGVVQMPFFVNRVEIVDPNMPTYAVPSSVKGNVVVEITDYRKFIKCNGLYTMFKEELIELIRDQVVANIRSMVGNYSRTSGTTIFEIGTCAAQIGKSILPQVQAEMAEIYGVNIKQVTIANIVLDTEDEVYKRYEHIVRKREEILANEQYAAATRNIEDKRQLELELQARMNEEAQRLRKLQSESQFIGAHQINVQGEVAKTAAESLGQLGANPGMSMGDGGGGMNPAAMMTGMMMGTAVGGNMTSMMGNMMQGVSTPQPPPPPPGMVAEWHIVNKQGAQCGPFNLGQIREMIVQGAVALDTYVWKQGMAGWAFAKDVMEIVQLFGTVPPPPPPVPQVPPVPQM